MRAPMSTLLHPHQALEQQHRAADQHHRHRDFRCDDRRGAARSCCPLEPRVALFSAAAADPVDTRSAGSTPTSTDTASATADAKAEHAQVQRDVGGERQIERQQRHRDADQQRGQSDAGHAAERAEHQAFGQQLRHDAPAAGAQRGAHGDLLASRGAPRQQQVGDVRARDQQHQDHRAKRDVDRLAQRVADQQLDRTARPRRSSPSSTAGMVSAICARTASRSACACSIETPGFSRADRIQPVRAGGQFLGGECIQSPEAGRLLERPRAVAIERARPAARRSTRCGSLSSSRSRSRIAGIAAEVAVCHAAWLRMTTRRRRADPPPA